MKPVPVQVMMIHGFVVMARAEQANRLLQKSGLVDTSCRACHRCTWEWQGDSNGGEYPQYGASGYPFSNPIGADVTGGMNGNLCKLPGSGTCRDRIILFRNAGRVSFQQGEHSPTDSHSVEKRRDRVRAGPDRDEQRKMRSIVQLTIKPEIGPGAGADRAIP
jgi:hypothetical protein